MADTVAGPGNFQTFSMVAPGTVTFARNTSGLLITVETDGTTVDFDGENGTAIMGLREGTYQFTNLRVRKIVFGGTGNVSGAGYCT